jgi:hypothetical protein
MITYALRTSSGSYKISSPEALPTEGWARIIVMPDGARRAFLVINGEPYYDITDVDGNLVYGEHLDPVFQVVEEPA